jgi:hypothetical protein
MRTRARFGGIMRNQSFRDEGARTTIIGGFRHTSLSGGALRIIQALHGIVMDPEL